MSLPYFLFFSYFSFLFYINPHSFFKVFSLFLFIRHFCVSLHSLFSYPISQSYENRFQTLSIVLLEGPLVKQNVIFSRFSHEFQGCPVKFNSLLVRETQNFDIFFPSFMSFKLIFDKFFKFLLNLIQI